MKSKNQKDIYTSYLIFIGYFSALLLISIVLWSLFIQTRQEFNYVIKSKKDANDLYSTKYIYLSNQIDSINHFIQMFNTGRISNEDALEIKIIKMKNECIAEIESIEKSGLANFPMHKKILLNIDIKIETKKDLKQMKEEENNIKKKLQDCTEANIKLKHTN